MTNSIRLILIAMLLAGCSGSDENDPVVFQATDPQVEATSVTDGQPLQATVIDVRSASIYLE